MNPLDFIDAYEHQLLSKITKDKINNNKTLYTEEEVIKIINEMSEKARAAIYNGEFIFNLEDINNQTITVDDKSFNMKKILSKNDGFILILQMTDVPEGEMTYSDLDILSDQISEAVKKAKNIEGVLILPPNFDIALLTAKTNIKDYGSKLLDLTAEDLQELEQYIKNKAVSPYRATGSVHQ